MRGTRALTLANVEALTGSMSPCLLSYACSTGFGFEQPLPVETGAQMVGNNFLPMLGYGGVVVRAISFYHQLAASHGLD